MLYYKDDATLTYFKFYGELRFKPKRGGSVAYKNVLHKRMHYLPLITWLKRLYVSISLAPHIRWHFENWRSDGVMTHVTSYKHIRHARVMGLYLEVVTTTIKDF